MDMISRIRDAFVQPARQALALHENQIIQGKITKIFPNNKAEIQIGQHQLIAEITTPLSIGKSYFFQVQSVDQFIQLKVIGEQARQDVKVQIEALLDQLGLKTSKSTIALLDQLVKEKIPFNREQLIQAFELLNKSANKQEAMEIIKEMLSQKLPVTDSIFQSLHAQKSDTLTTLLNDMYSHLKQLPTLTTSEATLLKSIETLIQRPVSVDHPVVAQLMKNISTSESFLQALKVLGLVDIHVSPENFTKQMAQLLSTKEGIKQQVLPQGVQHEVVASKGNELVRAMEQLVQNMDAIQKAVAKINVMFNGLDKGGLPQEQFTVLKNIIQDELLPLLPKETAQVIQHHLGQARGSNQQALFQVIDILGKQGVFQELSTIISTEVNQQEQQFIRQPMQEQFLLHVRNYLQMMGLNEEFNLKMNLNNMQQQEIMNQQQSVKSMLLQFIQQDHTAVSDRAQSLLHFVNGMQLQSVVETNNLLQASMTIPGEKLALNQDIFMQFEGKKGNDDKIDTDYCRILFVLDLANLKETMIDMHIQKRIISVTVFNEKPRPELGVLQPLLQEELEGMNYQLSSIQWKGLYEKQLPEGIRPQSNIDDSENQSKERFDFLI